MSLAPTSERVVQQLRRVSDRLAVFPSERTQRIMLGAALPLLIIGAILSYQTADLELGDLRVVPLTLAATVALPFVVAVNAWEYRTTGRAVGQSIPVKTSFRIAVLSTVLNYLPGHGGALLRIQALRRDGSAYRRAGGATLAAGLIWIGVAALIPGMWLTVAGQRTLGVALGLGGGLALALAAISLAQAETEKSRRNRLLVSLATIETLSVTSLAFRYYLLLIAIGYDHQPELSAFVLSLASVLAAATGVMPGGLGIRELLATALAPIAGLPLSFAFLITTMDRILGLSGHAAIAMPLLRSTDSPLEEQETVSDPHADDKQSREP